MDTQEDDDDFGRATKLSEITDTSQVDPIPLGLDALFDVQKELYQVTAKWQSIGIALRLDPNILNCIQARNNAEPQACLSSVLTEWLKRNYNVKRFGEPTWQWLVDAVGDPACGAHMALARDIARRYNAHPPSLVSSFPVRPLLPSHNCFSISALSVLFLLLSVVVWYVFISPLSRHPPPPHDRFHFHPHPHPPHDHFPHHPPPHPHPPPHDRFRPPPPPPPLGHPPP